MSIKSKILKLESTLNPKGDFLIVAHNQKDALKQKQEHLKINPHARFIIMRPERITKPPNSGE